VGGRAWPFHLSVPLNPSLTSYSPVYGVIFLFKYIGAAKDGLQDGTYDTEAVDEDNLFFAAQTIQNACGTQAILSVILNNDPTSNASSSGADTSETRIDIGPSLREFKDFTTGFPADLRGEALSNSSLIRETHNSFAKSSPFADETQKDPHAGMEDVFHFIGYTTHSGKLYELDGLQPYPISHGECTPDSFPEKIIPVLQKRIEHYPVGEVRFNLMAVCRDLRITAKMIGDQETLVRERKKRSQWEWENALRRHNFVGFTGEVLKEVVAMKLKDGSYQAWVEESKKVTEKRMKERRAKAEAER
jgi:ubiquitin carboxyl-terminal hydrolase L5